MPRSKVAVLRTKPDTVLQDIEKLMKLADFENYLDKNSVTILKDNISWHLPYLSSNTTPWQLEGVIIALKNAGFDKLVAVHNNTVVTDPFKGGKLNKLEPIYKKYGIEERYNFIKTDIKWIRYEPKHKMLALHKVYPKGIHIPEFFIGKNIIHLPTMKTHIYTTTTGAMKNAFGGLLNTRRHYTHTWIHETLVDLLAIQKEIHTGIFAVMDGTIAGNGPGPRTMIPVETDYILASADQVAIDAVSAKIMGFDPMKIKYIRLAYEAGLGVGDPREIEIVGEDISNVNLKFFVGDNMASRVGDILWFGPLKGIQYLFFRTPLVYIFVFGSYFYHDFVWWPLKGKKIQEKLRKSSKWGKLFESYPLD
ncbi:MAG: DUF362 domain-containing protein [Candidatus Kryptonium sp.]|nr:DUF362 domain-containing protein [Candidatus Kryptonium sp.]MDW8109763.1 DUF362 domain-containing protein [Candidatus Kryptonium sp.]